MGGTKRLPYNYSNIMKQLTKNQLQLISKKLTSLFNLATDLQIIDGKKWYTDANEFCKGAYKLYDGKFSHQTIVGVLSALSPRNKWAQNKIDTIKVLDAVCEGKDATEIKVCTFHSNKFKAFEIAKGEQFITLDSRKTFSFVQNIAELNPNFVTIDVWHLRACFYKTKGSIGKIAYEQIEKLTIKQAEKLGLKGYEYQAILWLVIQSKFDGKTIKL